ncbi:hypothetical protein ACFUCV_03130 [Specibacter sp. NPDC057265]|uniref:hypothetical protein n=1 Tax=Specibacter sp. NPDC057265 TaxID=3346075 RepID=UPI003634F845
MTNFQTITSKTPLHRTAPLLLALLGLSLSACSPQAAPADPATEDAPAVAAPTTAEAPAASASGSPDVAAPAAGSAGGKAVTVNVQGSRSEALVKTVIVSAEGKESGGEMNTEKLPYNQELTLPGDSTFTKIIVVAKYANGATADLSCSITIDGSSVASDSSSGHKPAECLFVEENHK